MIKGKPMTIEELDRRLQDPLDGRSIHTRNKARFYLERGADNKFRKELIKACEKALSTDDWRPVSEMLAGKW
jgi:hypothetical protein